MKKNEYIKKIAIIILNYNSYEKLVQCIASIRTCCKKEDYIIYIIDNNSSNNVDKLHMLSNKYKYDKTFCFIFLDSNKGYSNGNLVGINQAIKDKCQYIFIVNPDVIFLDDGISEMIRVLNSYTDIMMVGPDIVDNGKSIRYVSDTLNYRYYFLHRDVQRVDPIVKKEDGNIECYKGALLGCCFAFRSEILNNFFVFDPNIFLYREEQLIAKYVKEQEGYVAITLNTQIQHNHLFNSNQNGFFYYYSTISSFYILKKYDRLNIFKSISIIIKNLIFILGGYCFKKIKFDNLSIAHYLILNIKIIIAKYSLLK